jgi:hypothetical protein
MTAIIATRYSKIDYNDIIVFQTSELNEPYVKRIIGIPKDTISVKAGIVNINGKDALNLCSSDACRQQPDQVFDVPICSWQYF